MHDKELKIVAVILGILIFSCILTRPLGVEAGQSVIHEFRLGILDHDTDNLWSGSSRENGIDFNAEIVFVPHADFLHGSLRPDIGISLNDQGDTSKVYGGGVWEYMWRNGLFFDSGAGLAIHDGEKKTAEVDKKELGRKLLLHFSAELGYSLNLHHRLSLMFDHISNGYTAEPNEGLDTVGVRYGYVF
jgi:lipid A 3-O-deacylase